MIKIEGLSKFFRTEEVETIALNGVSMEVKDGEFVAIMGPSGCGKTALLRAIGGFAKPTEGKIRMDDVIYSGNGKMVPSDAYWYLDRCGK